MVGEAVVGALVGSLVGALLGEAVQTGTVCVPSKGLDHKHSLLHLFDLVWGEK
jgi:hypothetical protein